MPLLTHVLWGAIFCIPNGFSFEALRFSTLTISLISVIGAFLLAKELDCQDWLACLLALTIAFNPIYFALSNTFMTDASFTAMTIIAVLIFVRVLKNNSGIDLLVGSIIIVAATLNRQLGLAFSLAFTISYILKNGFRFRVLIRAAVPTILCIAALLIFEHWLEATGRLPALYHIKNEGIFQALDPAMLQGMVKNILTVLLYLGWFSLAFSIIAFTNIWSSLSGKTSTRVILSIIGLGLFGLLCLFLWQQPRHLMPISDNIIDPAGIGPLTLLDTYIILITSHVAALPASFWFIISVMSLIGAALLLLVIGVGTIRVLPSFKPGCMTVHKAVFIFFLSSFIIYLIPITLTRLYDRYLIPLLLPLLAIIVASLPNKERLHPAKTEERILVGIVLLLLGFFFMFSTLATRDYITWNRVRWTALDALMEDDHIAAEDIDGGFEFNGLYLYKPDYQPAPPKSWWWVEGNTFVIAFGPIPGYSIIREYEYDKWLPPAKGSILVLKKDADNQINEENNDGY